jgi:hypothetical protein
LSQTCACKIRHLRWVQSQNCGYKVRLGKYEVRLSDRCLSAAFSSVLARHIRRLVSVCAWHSFCELREARAAFYSVLCVSLFPNFGVMDVYVCLFFISLRLTLGL